MDWSIKWLDSSEYVRADVSGTFSLPDAKSLSAEIVENSDWSNGDEVLINETDLDVGTVNASDIESMSRMMAQLDNKVSMSKVAIVGPSDIQFGLARQFQIKAESHTTATFRVFRGEAAAIQWLTDGVSSFSARSGSVPSFPLIMIM